MICEKFDLHTKSRGSGARSKSPVFNVLNMQKSLENQLFFRASRKMPRIHEKPIESSKNIKSSRLRFGCLYQIPKVVKEKNGGIFDSLEPMRFIRAYTPVESLGEIARTQIKCVKRKILTRANRGFRKRFERTANEVKVDDIVGWADG